MTETQIQDWLKSRIAKEGMFTEAEIDIQEPFVTYGLDSVAATSMTYELEELLEVSLPATLYWDYPSIETLSKHLTDMPKEKPAR